MASVPYKLSCVLYGHTLDVRSIAVTQEGCIVSGSRDRSAKVWRPNGINTGYNEVQSFLGHANFVSCVCALSPNSKYPSGLILTGSNDNHIRIFVPDASQPISILKGHSNAVCNLSPGVKNGTVVSASWDATARLWNTDGTPSPVVTLHGHQVAVWSAIQLATGSLITGSADKTIKVWLQDGVLHKTLTGHTDCVRGLAATSANEFLSCSNDATVRHWNASMGTCLATFYGHSNYIYSISLLPQGSEDNFVTSGEDRTIRIWLGGEVQQTLVLPAQSVWSVASLSNGDIVAGSSDGMVRIFSCDPNRQADSELQKQFDEQVASMALSTEQELGGVKISDLPGKEVLYEPGRTDGQTKLVRDGGAVHCYSWSTATNEWTKVGDVLGASGGSQNTSGKQLYKGKEYDFVFSVDIEDGKPALKLPYNMSEDPWFAAQKFIHDNSLSQVFLDQVANFIVTNSRRDQTPGPAVPPGFIDPLTGGNRYIPGSGSTAPVAPAPTADPFTGASRYVPSVWSGTGSPATNGLSAGSVDSLTGDSSYRMPGMQSDPYLVKPYFPQKTYIRFDQANLKLILEKLLELNRKTGDGSHKVEESQLEGVVKLGDLDSPASAPHLQVLKQLLEWPPDIIFPVLDVTRLAVRNAEVNADLCSGRTGERLLAFLRHFLLPDALTANQMLALRILSNMLSHPDGERLALKHKDYLLSAARDLSPPFSKQMQVALVTLLLNLSVAFDNTRDSSSRLLAVEVSAAVLPRMTDPEAQFRLLVALGTLLWDPADRASLVARVGGPAGELRTLLDRLAAGGENSSDSPALKVARCAAQVVMILQ